jgi:chromosome segregation ATPase
VEPSTVSARLIGAMFLEKGLITEAQLESALQEQRTTGERLGEILVERFGISRLDLASALAEQWAQYERPGAAESPEPAAPGEEQDRDLAAVSSEWNGSERDEPPSESEPRRPIGEIFLERGLLTSEQLEHALTEQKQTGERLGEILVARGVVSRLELASALADQWASLQKLRPPGAGDRPQDPSEPERQAADDAGDLRAQVADLATRVDDSERRLADAGPEPELRSSLEALESKVDGLLESPAVPEAVASLAARLDHVSARLDGLASLAESDALKARLDEVAARLDDLARPGAEEVVAPLRAELDGLSARLGDVAGRVDETNGVTAGLARLDDALGSLTRKIDELDRAAAAATSADELASVRSALSELTARLDAIGASTADAGALAERIAALESRPQEESSGAAQELGNMRTAVIELNARVAKLAAMPSADEVVSSIRTQLATLAAKVGELARELESAPSGAGGDSALDAALAELTGRVDGLAEAVAAVPILSEAVDPLRAEVNALGQRTDRLVESLTERIDQLGAAIAATPGAEETVAPLRAEVEELAARLAAEAAARESAAERLAALERRPPDPPALAEVRSELAALGLRVGELADPSAAHEARERFDALEARLGDTSTTERLGDELSALAHRVDALARSIDSVPELESTVAPLRGAVEELSARLAAEAAARESAAERLAALEGRPLEPPGLAELRSELAALGLRVGELADPSAAHEARERFDALEARLGDTSATERLGEELAALARRLEELGRVDPESLASRLDATEGRSETAVRAAEALEAVAAELRSRLDDLAARAGERDRLLETLGTGAGELRGLVTALSERVDGDRSLERAEAVLSERLGELEERLTHAAGGEDRLRDVLTALVHDARAQLEEQDRQLHARVDESAAAIAALTAGAERVDELERRLADQSDLERRLRETLAPLDEAAAAIREDQEALRDRLAEALQRLSSVDSVAGRLADLELRLSEGERLEERLRESVDVRLVESLAPLAGALGELRSQLEDVAAAGVSPEALEGALGRLEAVEQRLGAAAGATELSDALESVTARLDELAGAASSGADALRGELAAARADLAAETRELEQRLEAQRSRVEEVAAAGVDAPALERLHHRVEGLAHQLDSAPGAAELRDALRGELDGVEQRLRDALDAQEPRLADHERRLGELGEHHDIAARVGALEARVDERAGSADDAVAAIRRELDETRARLAGEAEALEERLRSAFEESAGAAAQVERRARQEDLDELRRQLVGDKEQAAEAASKTERAIADLTDRQDRHEERTTGEREAALADAHATVRSLAERVEGLESRADEGTEPALSAVREQLAALAQRLDDAEHRAEEAHGALGRALEGVDGRIEDAALRSAEHAAAIEHAVRRELESLAATAEERDAAAIDARAEAREQLERLTSSLAWRIERVEEALAGDDRDELRDLVGSLERRVDAQAAQSDELARQTEKALRKGLASLGARLSESEEAYVEAGHVLRRSIERLGLAVRDADERLAPGAPAAARVDSSYLAFAPVGDAYRLVELPGPAPAVGDEVALPDGVDGLVVTRVSRSPLPFDTRSCVYLERGRPDAD